MKEARPVALGIFFATSMLSCQHPGWNRTSGQDIYQCIFKEDAPAGLKVIRGEMDEYRSLFGSVETWEWYLMAKIDDTTKEKITGDSRFEEVPSAIIPGQSRGRSKVPAWFAFSNADSIKTYERKMEGDGFLFSFDPRTEIILMSNIGARGPD